MEQRRIQALMISGLCVLCSGLPHEYHLVSQAQSWPEAQRYCRTRHTDLATLEGVEDTRTLLSALGSSFDGRAWIGLEVGQPHKWMWSMYRTGDTILFNTEGFPSFEHCVVMHSTGQGHSYYCDARFPSVCYNETSQEYSLVPTVMSWWGAQQYCRDHHTDLASVNNVSQQSVVMVAAQQHYVWVGLFRDAWAWSDQSPSSFRQWVEPQVPGQLNTCAATSVVHSGKWEVWPCSTSLPFVCQGAPRSKQFVFKMKMVTDTDLTDHVVSDQLLQQINQMMANQGLSDYDLHWRDRPKISQNNKEEEEVKEEEIVSAGFCGA